MNLRSRMMIRCYAPAVGLALVGAGLTWLALKSTESRWLIAFLPALRYSAAGAFLSAVAASLVAMVALLRWEAGRTTVCACGGMLGFERDGRWGSYKRCLGCGRNVARKHYEDYVA